MNGQNIYKDIAQRTQGDIYIGVVGPVRTGKSTFIKRFMENLVLPNINDNFKKERAVDELPQSAAGRTIMTTEPKFIPNEAVTVNLGDDKKAALRVRLIDCVGYIVPSALGYIEDDMPRMVTTPWFEKEIPFNMAAEIGTKKVICEHSTIGLMITTDGTIGEIPRDEYLEAEERVVKELKDIDKPFIVLVNSAYPKSKECIDLCVQLADKYGVSVLPVNCLELTEPDIKAIIQEVLFEFPIKEISVDMPTWINSLPDTHWLKSAIYSSIFDAAGDLRKIKEIGKAASVMKNCEYVKDSSMGTIDLGRGAGVLKIELDENLFYKIISETTGLEINDEGALVNTIAALAEVNKEYSKIKNALNEAETKGYGIVTPGIDELTLEEPEIVKQGGRFGVKLKASAPSLHIIKADIETEVSPIVGSEKQSEELVRYLLAEFEQDPKKIWESNIFGKSVHELVNEGLQNKLNRMPDDARFKLQETLQRIINEGSGGLICIIL